MLNEEMDLIGFQLTLPPRPCPFYKHGLCLLGSGCKLSHANPEALAGGDLPSTRTNPQAIAKVTPNEELSDTRDGGGLDSDSDHLDQAWPLSPKHVTRDTGFLEKPRNKSSQFGSSLEYASSLEDAMTTNDLHPFLVNGNMNIQGGCNGIESDRSVQEDAQVNFHDFQQSVHPFSRYGVGTLPRVRDDCSSKQAMGSSLSGFGRGRGLALGSSCGYQPLRRPGRDAAERAGKSFFCHQCKQDISMIRADLACPLCLGDFIEESSTVERAQPQMIVPSLSPDPANAGFAWVPPAHLYQAFLKKEDKLVDLAGANPYLYLEDEDALDDDFPCLDSPLPPVLDERIAAKEKSKSRLNSFAGSLPENGYSSCDHDEKHSEEDSGGDIEEAGSLQEKQKLSIGQKRRRRKEARRVALKIRKNESKAELNRKEMAKKELEEMREKTKEEERRNKAKVRSMQELESKIIRLKLAQNLQLC